MMQNDLAQKLALSEAQREALEAENAALREENDALRQQLASAGWRPPVELGLTPNEAVVLGVLMARDVATKDAIHTALYGLEIDGGAEPKIVDVFICKIRAKLRRAGLTDAITTVWGVGYALTEAHKTELRDWGGTMETAA
jgi:two-component system cell cycle response regulator CtrA